MLTVRVFAIQSLLVSGLILLAYAQPRPPNDVIFQNSLTDESCFDTRGVSFLPSSVELVDGKLPVEKNIFFNPPNALRLTWSSRTPGNWEIVIRLNQEWNRRTYFAGDVLSFWCYSSAEISPAELPSLYLRDARSTRTPPVRLGELVSSIPTGKWFQVKVPLNIFTTSPDLVRHTDELDFHHISSISLQQSADDGKQHTLYLDEIKIYTPVEDPTPPSAPKGVTAQGYDSHVDLAWDPSRETDLQGYIVYRSLDGQTYKPIGTQDGRFCRYADFIGESEKTASYKVTAFDINYNESRLSGEATARTRKMSDDELLTMVQQAAFRYYWESGHPDAGMALEHVPVPGDEDLVALGASGFGIMATVVAMERDFINREQGSERLEKIVGFLEKADRFHGVWPHFLDGRTGKVVPRFGKYDNGGDLIETAFLMEGLLTTRQYFKDGNERERNVSSRITKLWETVEWDWYRNGPDTSFLYWHWSPDYEWYINHPVVGWNEAMIVYLLAIASTTHPVPASMYYSGWAGQSDRALHYRQNWGKTSEGDHYCNGNTYYGIKLDVGVGRGGALWFTHYSFMGFDPRNKRDRYTNYFENSRNMALIHRAYCMENPNEYKGYSDSCWGIELSADPAPKNDRGILSPTQALGSLPYTPQESMKALKCFYHTLGRELWGIYGFRDAIKPANNWVSSIYMGLNQGPITVMIENYRSGLVWKLFMSNPEIQMAMQAIGFVEEKAQGPLLENHH